MLQAKLLITAAALCTAGFLADTVAQAETAPLVTDRSPNPTEELPEAELPASDSEFEVAESEPLECPPGQFPSAFADVYPWEWAYEAINNLASPSMECFDLPEEYR